MKTMRYPTPLVYVHQWCTPTKPLAIHLQAVAPYAEPWVFLLPVATQRRPRLRSRRAEVSRHAMRRVPTLAFRRVGQNGSDMVSRQARKVPQDDGRSAHHVGAGSDHGLAHSH